MNTDFRLPHRNEHTSKTEHCDHKENSKFNILINVIEKVSAIALGAFSLYTNWQLFVPFFFVGGCIGVYSYTKETKSCHDHHPASSCGGLIEDLTGVKLPPLISTIAGIAVTVCHIEHHASVFVPIIGVALGNWMGKTASHYGAIAYKNITVHSGNKFVLAN